MTSAGLVTSLAYLLAFVSAGIGGPGLFISVEERNVLKSLLFVLLLLASGLLTYALLTPQQLAMALM